MPIEFYDIGLSQWLEEKWGQEVMPPQKSLKTYG